MRWSVSLSPSLLYAKPDDMVRKNAQRVLNQEEYLQRFNTLSEKCAHKKDKLTALKKQAAEKKIRLRKLKIFLDKLKAAKELTDFDEHVFTGVIEQIIVRRGEKENEKVLTFCFKNGTQIVVNV